MNDYFVLLNEPRRPWIDAEELKERFVQLSRDVHPDRFHNAPEAEKAQANDRYLALSTASQCLGDPRDRLLHLLELEVGAPPPNVQRIPPGTMELFMEVGQACRDVDSFLAERAKVRSPMLKVQLFQKGLEWTESLTSLQHVVNAKGAAIAKELREMNPTWEAAPPVGSAGRAAALPLARLEELYRVLSYITRWTEQIQERVVQLTM